MSKYNNNTSKSLFWVMGFLILATISIPGYARVLGITGPTFSLSANTGFIKSPDGGSIFTWGYSDNNGTATMQYPGPTLIVNQGDTVTITLSNKLNEGAYIGLGEKTSLIFPGQSNVTVTGGTAGMFTNETVGGAQTVTYSFTATNAGTYMYHSGTNQELQLEMGLVGALIVRPVGAGVVDQAYSVPDTDFNYEYLFLLTELDPIMHELVEFARTPADLDLIDNTLNHSVFWYINGRNGPDTLAPDLLPSLPNQPYSSLAQIHPGEKALLRIINAGRDLHPFHTHGNHYRLIARDGRVLKTAASVTADLTREDFTVHTVPGATYDAIWTWTGTKMGWDIFGDNTDMTTPNHGCTPAAGTNFDVDTKEYCPDHGKKFPVTQSDAREVTFGGYYSGSPFIGAYGSVPTGEGGLNITGGMYYMWHSHTEREIINNNAYPGGMLTMMIVEPAGVQILK